MHVYVHIYIYIHIYMYNLCSMKKTEHDVSFKHNQMQNIGLCKKTEWLYMWINFPG